MALATQRVGQYLETIPDGEPNDPNWVVDTIERMAGRPEVKTLVPPRFYKDPLKPWHGAVYAARRGMKITPETFGLAYAQHAAAALPVLRDINHAAGYFLRLQVDIPGPPDLTAFSFGPLWSRYYDTVVEALSLQVRAIEETGNTRLVYQLSIPVETYLVARARRLGCESSWPPNLLGDWPASWPRPCQAQNGSCTCASAIRTVNR